MNCEFDDAVVFGREERSDFFVFGGLWEVGRSFRVILKSCSYSNLSEDYDPQHSEGPPVSGESRSNLLQIKFVSTNKWCISLGDDPT